MIFWHTGNYRNDGRMIFATSRVQNNSSAPSWDRRKANFESYHPQRSIWLLIQELSADRNNQSYIIDHLRMPTEARKLSRLAHSSGSAWVIFIFRMLSPLSVEIGHPLFYFICLEDAFRWREELLQSLGRVHFLFVLKGLWDRKCVDNKMWKLKRLKRS